LFFKDSKKVTGDPEQVARLARRKWKECQKCIKYRIFHNAIQYLITNVVGHIRNINMQEMELMAICGIFLWSDCKTKKYHEENAIKYIFVFVCSSGCFNPNTPNDFASAK
jgi:hypothetical protein